MIFCYFTVVFAEHLSPPNLAAFEKGQRSEERNLLILLHPYVTTVTRVCVVAESCTASVTMD